MSAVLESQLALLEPTAPAVVRLHLVGTVRRACVCTAPAGDAELVVELEPAGGGDEIVARYSCDSVNSLHSLAARLPAGIGAIVIAGGVRSFKRQIDSARVVQLLHVEHVAPVTP